MTFVDLISKIKSTASAMTLVNDVFDGDIYDNFSDHNIKYGAFNVDVETVEMADGVETVYTYMYYADRLLQDKSNALAIKDDAANVLNSIINKLNRDKSIVEVNMTYTITPFEQKFDDYLAGAYVRVGIVIRPAVKSCGMEDLIN